MDSAELDNDIRGWIMCIVSGIACVVGSSVIYIDLIIQRWTSMKDFRLQDSNVFMASSLSLSFGVMLFSALYGILPSSKKYLEHSGFSSPAAAWVLLICFIAGFMGIQVIGKFLHKFIPSHVEDCDHTHADCSHQHAQDQSKRGSSVGHGGGQHLHKAFSTNGRPSESTPLLVSPQDAEGKLLPGSITPTMVSGEVTPNFQRHSESISRSPSMLQVQKTALSLFNDRCNSDEPCYGYSEPCGQNCLNHLSTIRSANNSRRGTIQQAINTLNPQMLEEECPHKLSSTAQTSTSVLATRALLHDHGEAAYESQSSDDSEDLEAQHHHHVPENAFMNIGLQTAIAIALHKLPEGFITYATNHANPSLGWSVFMALFIHNISEGLILALTLYLAINSRIRAMFWSAFLGGLSQPMGAGIAAAWFKIAGKHGHQPGEAVYGCMFAITAGIMTSVALHLFVESLSLNHNRGLCIAFAFIGMCIMAMSNALTTS